MAVETDTLLKPAQAAAVLNMTERALESWRWRRCGPPFAKVGRSVRYRRADLDAWVERQLRGGQRDAAQ